MNFNGTSSKLTKLQQQYNGISHQNGVLQQQLQSLNGRYLELQNKYNSGNITQTELYSYKQIVSKVKSLSSQINSNNQKLSRVLCQINQEQQRIMMRGYNKTTSSPYYN